jgi:general stress protein YciG
MKMDAVVEAAEASAGVAAIMTRMTAVAVAAAAAPEALALGMRTKTKKMIEGAVGAEARHDKSPEEESRIARKTARTRMENDPDAFREMGRKGGRA